MSKFKASWDLVLPWRRYSMCLVTYYCFRMMVVYSTYESFGMVLLLQKSPLSADTVVGQGNTSAWKMCGLDKKTSLCVVFDIVRKDAPDTTDQSKNEFYFQFLT
jgi:hypothetical protein